MTELKKKVEDLIKAYRENASSQSEVIRNSIEQIKVNADKYKPEGLAQELNETINPVLEGWKGIDQMYNQKFHTILDDAEKEFQSSIKTTEIKDSAIKVNNALQMINMMSPDTDEKAQMILKEFIDAKDYKNLKIFKEIIGQNVEMENANGEPVFEKTFADYNRFETISNLFAELHDIGDNLFLHERQIQDILVNTPYGSFGVPEDGYTEFTDEQYSITCSEQIDRLVNA